MLIEPASSVTDAVLALAALFAASSLSGEGKTYTRWRWAFVFIGAAALLGAVHHGFLEETPSVARHTWAAITILVAISISFVLSATISTVLGEGRGKILLAVRTVSLAVFIVLAVMGHATMSTLMISEGGTMLIILGLWATALWKRTPVVTFIIASIVISGAGGVVRSLPVGVDIGGWHFGGAAWFHIMQTLGIVLLFFGVERWGYRRVEARKIRRGGTWVT
ncbi:MAG: hypothetical protein FJ320_07520 [SAR202 cluster bacterium]|nr:hypothetical protein [SAR202 cluster bacterium]